MSIIDILRKKGNGGKKDIVAEIVEMESGPVHPWDKSPSLGTMFSMGRGNVRELKVADTKEGWAIRDALNNVGVVSWFPEPGKKTGLLVYYNYNRDITPEELSVLVKKFQGGGSRDGASRPKSPATTVQRTSR